MRLSDEPLVTADAIRECVARLAAQIDQDHAGRDLVLVVVLKGAIVFAGDLMRRLATPHTVAFVRARSYQGSRSSGTIDLAAPDDVALRDKHLVVVEDILDTGATTVAILQHLRTQNPAGLRLCVLLDKPARRTQPVSADYVGLTIDNHFVVGYGLDHDEHYRHLSDIRILEDL
jgi:hypoxanthine phosphoribosyltransferase